MRALRAAWLPALFLALLLVVPLVAFFRLAAPATELGAWERGRLGASVQLGALTAGLALLVGLPLAWLVGRHDFPGRRLLRALLTVPFVLPVVVVAAGVLAMLGPASVGTYRALLLAHVVYNVPLVVRLVGDAWSHLDPRPEEAAATLGAGPAARFLRVTLPRLAPAVLAAALLAFLFGFTAFGTVLLLADPIEHATLEAAIYHVGLRVFDLRTAATLALVQLAFTAAVVLAYARVLKAVTDRERPVPESVALRPLGRASRPLVAGAFALAALLLLPVAAVLVRALHTPDGWGLGAFERLGTASGFFATPERALANSLRFAALTVLVALPVGVLAALAAARARRGHLLDAAWMLPLGTSAVTLALGLLVVFPLRAGPLALDLRATATLLVLAHALVAFPFVVRAMVGPLRARDPAPAEAARTLGAGPWRRLVRVEAPILGPALVVGAVLAASVSLGEFAATLVLSRPEFATLPTEIYRHLASSRPDPWILPEAFALGSILVVVDVAAFLALERLRPGRAGGF